MGARKTSDGVAMTEYGVYLKNTHGGHYKHYFLAITKLPLPQGLYALRTAYGKIGAKPKEDAKNRTFNTLSEAHSALEDIVREKRQGGYEDGGLPSQHTSPTWYYNPVSVPVATAPKTPTAQRILSKFKERRRTAQWRF
jgi:predicted DNA-binding WGR domain protein